jgi:hypothetical protein
MLIHISALPEPGKYKVGARRFVMFREDLHRQLWRCYVWMRATCDEIHENKKIQEPNWIWNSFVSY